MGIMPAQHIPLSSHTGLFLQDQQKSSRTPSELHSLARSKGPIIPPLQMEHAGAPTAQQHLTWIPSLTPSRAQIPDSRRSFSTNGLGIYSRSIHPCNQARNFHGRVGTAGNSRGNPQLLLASTEVVPKVHTYIQSTEYLDRLAGLPLLWTNRFYSSGSTVYLHSYLHSISFTRNNLRQGRGYRTEIPLNHIENENENALPVGTYHTL